MAKTFWAIEFLVNPSHRRKTWFLDIRTLRHRKRDAKQAPLDRDPSPEYWDIYNAKLREGSARAVKVRLEVLP
jgi:hypothetical protein